MNTGTIICTIVTYSLFNDNGSPVFIYTNETHKDD